MSLEGSRAVTFVLTPNRPRAQAFYASVLGLPLLRENAFAAVYDLGGGTVLRLTNVEGHVPSPHTVLGWHVADIRAAMAELSARGVQFIVYPGMTGNDGLWTAPDGSVKVCWFNDPDGNNLSLTEG
jgi:catechol 2,3-dioxygenase-like lactoylglutathione lyase family enzyme